MQLSELPEDPEPSSSLGPCILRIIRLQLLASLAGCVLIFYYYRNAQLNKSSSSFFLLHEIELCLAGLLMASENTAMQSISEVHCNAISFDYYGIEIVKLKSKRPSAKQATD